MLLRLILLQDMRVLKCIALSLIALLISLKASSAININAKCYDKIRFLCTNKIIKRPTKIGKLFFFEEIVLQPVDASRFLPVT